MSAEVLLAAAAAAYVAFANRAKLLPLAKKGWSWVASETVPANATESEYLSALLLLRPFVQGRNSPAEIAALNTLLHSVIELPIGPVVPEKGV